MRTALVTGSSSGIGKAVYDKLQERGYKVFGISRSDTDIVCDLRDVEKLERLIDELLKQNDIDILINCAGVGIFGPHEQITVEKIEELIDVNLKAPIVLTNLVLKSLRKTKGHIINISSIEATRDSKFSALYSATKSGLRSFSLSLFEELRNTDIKVTNINPDITKTAFFDDLQFEPSDKEKTYMEAEDIAQQVLEILNSKIVVTDLTLRAQKFAITKKKT